jgi:hypothetical protein
MSIEERSRDRVIDRKKRTPNSHGNTSLHRNNGADFSAPFSCFMIWAIPQGDNNNLLPTLSRITQILKPHGF